MGRMGIKYKGSPTSNKNVVRMAKRKALGMTKFTVKFYAVIPVEARRIFNIKAGDRLIWYLEDGKLVVEKAP